MSSPLSNLLDGLWLSCQFYDGTKTQEREGEQRIFGDWAVIRSRGQAGHQVCVADPISSAAQLSVAWGAILICGFQGGKCQPC